MDAAARWAELVARPEPELPLDEAALLISAHAHPEMDVAAQLGRLDDLAASVGAPGAGDVIEALFGQAGLEGDRLTYDDPDNSFLDRVLDRRLGIPISLSVLLIEVGRRCGVALEPVGMPGHFLVRDPADPDGLIDAFGGGRRLRPAECEALLRGIAGPGARLRPGMLATTAKTAVLARMLANLDRAYERRHDHRNLRWVAGMRRCLPDLPAGDRVQVATRLAALGQFAVAADMLEETAARVAGADRDTMLTQASVLRARLN